MSAAGEGARPSARNRILDAADELARDVGPANLSLDAVAARAGVSKGGLLYHFPHKDDLLEALIERHLGRLSDEIEKRGAAEGGQSLLKAFLDTALADTARKVPPAAGVLAAMVQNPRLLAPIRRFNRTTLDRLTTSASNPGTALVVYLALEGLRSMKVFDLDVMTPAERQAAIDALQRIATQAV
jgi:AcrR family transcriptional regulator